MEKNFYYGYVQPLGSILLYYYLPVTISLASVLGISLQRTKEAAAKKASALIPKHLTLNKRNLAVKRKADKLDANFLIVELYATV